jgi:hypothetical protein
LTRNAHSVDVPGIVAYCRLEKAPKTIAREDAVVVRIGRVELLLKLSLLGSACDHGGDRESLRPTAALGDKSYSRQSIRDIDKE